MEIIAHAKGGMYETAASLWKSPDGRILVIVHGGKTAKIRTRTTSLNSILKDGRHIVSSDEWGTIDPSGKVQRETLPNAGFDELLAFHESRLAMAGGVVRPLLLIFLRPI